MLQVLQKFVLESLSEESWLVQRPGLWWGGGGQKDAGLGADNL